MARHKDKELGQELYASLEQISEHSTGSCTHAQDISRLIELEAHKTNELRKMKKFRFQLFHRWLVERFEPCRIADIAGGKGLLTHLLQKSGWQAVVIDPVSQSLPDKYKDIGTGKRVRIASTERVRRVDRAFQANMARHYDMLVGMHAHGCNVQVIDAAAEYGCGFVLFPCCVIDEPFYPPLGVHWLESVADYAVRKGHAVYPFRLNFKGQNIGLCAVGERQRLAF
ncbi:MAG: hypothetical protein GY832_34035 [Chloroflexi bacterium]|nr:hypothetical protein [Chloroflexota bacterium]